MITITLHGTDTARCGDMEASTTRGSAIGNLARKLVEAGHDRGERVLVYRGETVCFSGESLGWWADRTVTEGDSSVRFAKWAPFEKTQIGGAA